MTLQNLMDDLERSVSTLIDARTKRDESTAAKQEADKTAADDQEAYSAAVADTRAKIEALNAAL